MSWIDEKTCPICAERIKWAALICHYCGHEFTPEELSAQTAELRRVNELRTEFPNQLGDYSYRVENDKSVSAIDRNGNPINFGDWQSFWRTSQISSSGPSPPPLPRTQKPVAVAAGNRPPWPMITILGFVGAIVLAVLELIGQNGGDKNSQISSSGADRIAGEYGPLPHVAAPMTAEWMSEVITRADALDETYLRECGDLPFTVSKTRREAAEYVNMDRFILEMRRLRNDVNREGRKAFCDEMHKLFYGN